MKPLDDLAAKWAGDKQRKDMEWLAKQWNTECVQCIDKSHYPHCLPSCSSRRGR